MAPPPGPPGRAAQPGRAPGASTAAAAVPRTAPRAQIIQRFTDGTIDDAVREHVKANATVYPPSMQAGNCVVSAQEVGQVLGRLTKVSGVVGYAAVVYWDGGARNHIAATFTVNGERNVVDHAWKQFPFLAQQRTGGSSPFIDTIDAWQAMMRGHLTDVQNWQMELFDDIDEAREWMRQQLKPVAPDRGGADDGTGRRRRSNKKGCTIL
jgi:hypothetical protein